jgi:DNA-binding NarL/FixJ family response regulator
VRNSPRGDNRNRCGPRTRKYGPTMADPVAVDRAAAGDRTIGLAVVERAQAVARCTAQGLSIRETALRLGCCTATVTRHRKSLREAHSA